MLGYQMVHYKFLYGWWFYDKIDVKVKFCTFIFMSAAIWKGSKIILIVSLNMVYHIPVWKQENFYLGAPVRMYFFGPKSKSAICDGTTPHLHTKPNLNKCRSVAEVPYLQMELNYLDLLMFYCIFSDLSHPSSCGCMGGWEWVWVCLGVPHMPHIHAHAHMHTHMHNTKIYMYSNCKWLPPWRHPCLSGLTCMCTCVLVCGTPSTHTHPQPFPPTPPTPRGVTPQSS